MNIVQEYKDEIKKLQQERDLYRARAIDEVIEHHDGATRQIAALDVDLEVMKHLQGVPS